MAQHTVGVDHFCYCVNDAAVFIDNPLGAVQERLLAESKDMAKQLREQQDLIAELQAAKNSQHKGSVGLQEKLTLAEETLKEQREEIAILQDQLLQAKTDRVLEHIDVRTMASIMHSCPDTVIEALPHIGPETVQNVRKWAAKVLAETDGSEAG